MRAAVFTCGDAATGVVGFVPVLVPEAVTGAVTLLLLSSSSSWCSPSSFEGDEQEKRNRGAAVGGAIPQEVLSTATVVGLTCLTAGRSEKDAIRLG